MIDFMILRVARTCSYLQTSIEFRPGLQAQHDDAITKHQHHRRQLFASLLARVNQDATRTRWEPGRLVSIHR